MPIDFFKSPCDKVGGNCKKEGVVCKATTNAILFGLCDDRAKEKQPAHLDQTNEKKWWATIENPKSKNITFKAVDFCVDIYRSGNEPIKRCEGFLFFDNKILFFELKHRHYRGWLPDARMKFEETISAFKQNYPDNEIEILEPVVSNKLQYKTPQNLMIEKQKLKDKIGIEFHLRNSITVS